MPQHARLGGAVSAHYLKPTTGYAWQFERGAKRPTRSALVLLNVIRHQGNVPFL
jgi:DNA-binding transcriptional regulator YiaG